VARDASYWLARMRELRTKRDRYTLLAAALQDRVDGLTRDFDSTPDRRLRSTIDSELQRVRTERNLVAADVASVDKQIFDLEEEARRSNVPPGWLRP
jgi:chromosome segregation ATPase